MRCRRYIVSVYQRFSEEYIDVHRLTLHQNRWLSSVKLRNTSAADNV